MNSNIFQNWNIKCKVDRKKINSSFNNFSLNFGPQHPSAHGVLRLIIQLNSEIINKIDVHIGYLHRGTEKLIENKNYLKNIPYFDRLDYVSMVNQEHTYCLCLENILGKKNVKSNIFLQRILFDELTRILNHLLALSCHALDIGNMSPLFWAFEEREKIMEFYENLTGARMHAVMYKPNKVNFNIFKKNIIDNINNFSKNFFKTINELNIILSFNKIWKKRLVSIGSYSYKNSILFGLTGVMSRCTGLKNDVRLNKLKVYSNYNFIKLKSFLGINGDSYDRYLIRLNEMLESNKISINILSILKKKLKSNNYNKLKKKTNYNFMEYLIKNFFNWNDYINFSKNITQSFLESPKGEFCVFLKSDNSNKPFKIKIVSPSFKNLNLLKFIANGHFLTDLVTLIGTVDIVLGEIDK